MSNSKMDFASDICLYCGDTFTEDNPCWNDDGCTEDFKLHVDGECKRCAEVRQAQTSPQRRLYPGLEHFAT
jgi:hypothetical protein